jgi:hypothetical protein
VPEKQADKSQEPSREASILKKKEGSNTEALWVTECLPLKEKRLRSA